MSDGLGTIPIIESIADVSATRKAWLVDVWGVMHNGVRAFARAVDACRKFRSRGGTVIYITNAPRPNSAVVRQIMPLGVTSDAYDRIITSGDVTRSLIERWQGKRLLHLGPDRDKGLFDGLKVAFSSSEDAEVVLCSGLYDDTKETPDSYNVLFHDLIGRQVPMICANPDLRVERGDQLVYCAGALAQRYRELGGEVALAGKPYGPIYEDALRAIAELRGRVVGKSEVIAVGDGVHTDIEGAHAAGIDSVFIASGVHLEGRAFDDLSLASLFDPLPFQPIAAMKELNW